MRLEGDVITANGSILSGQIPREQGGGGGGIGLASSLINLEDSKSVCSCSCQAAHSHCFPCWIVRSRLRGRRAHSNSIGQSVEFGTFSTTAGIRSSAQATGRSYGALSSTGTFSIASLAGETDTFLERYIPGPSTGDLSSPTNQVRINIFNSKRWKLFFFN